MDLFLAALGAAASVGGIIYGIWQNRARVRVERLLERELSYLGGDLLNIRDSARWGDEHLLKIHSESIKREPDFAGISDLSATALRDVASIERMLTLSMSRVRALLDGQFDTVRIRRQKVWSPDVEEFDLVPVAQPSFSGSPEESESG
ncbi:hypothetical protein ACGF5M_00870 [Gemmatimonadota bacterium]